MGRVLSLVELVDVRIYKVVDVPINSPKVVDVPINIPNNTLKKGRLMKSFIFAVILSMGILSPLLYADNHKHAVSSLKVTTLSTMMTEIKGVGEWGYAALVEVDGQQLLFDTGGRPDTVHKNAAELGFDLSQVDTVFLSHNHWDHTAGLTTLRQAFRSENPDAFGTTHVGEGVFAKRVVDEAFRNRPTPMPAELLVSMLEHQQAYEALGGRFVTHDKPHELYPGVWITGPIPRVHPEKNWSTWTMIETTDGLVEDTIPEDQALVINTAKGLVIIAGCGHAGIVNTIEYAQKLFDGRKVHAVIGGFHLMVSSDDALDWTGKAMKKAGTEHLIGAHCTGIHALERLRVAASLGRKTAIVGAVGSSFSLDKQIVTGPLTH